MQYIYIYIYEFIHIKKANMNKTINMDKDILKYIHKCMFMYFLALNVKHVEILIYLKNVNVFFKCVFLC